MRVAYKNKRSDASVASLTVKSRFVSHVAWPVLARGRTGMLRSLLKIDDGSGVEVDDMSAEESARGIGSGTSGAEASRRLNSQYFRTKSSPLASHSCSAT